MELFLDLLPYIVIAIVFYNIGSHVRAFQISINLSKDPDKFIALINKIKDLNELEELDTPVDAIEVTTEKVNDKATGEFLAQAHNLQQVMVLAAARYPGKKFWHPELKQDHQTT